MHALDGFPNVFRARQRESDVNTPDDKYTVFGFNFAACFRCKLPLTRIDFARLQRAPEGSKQSAGSRSHDVIDGRRMRLLEFSFVNPIVLRDSAMNAEHDGILLARQVGDPQRRLPPFKPDV